ncbi:MAG: magnesium chelatase domain-containing protein, partial [Hydrogenovibrio sp.]|nr:magnesium chelatase domain-containing protein [Hydrogenovibrio sp.]
MTAGSYATVLTRAFSGMDSPEVRVEVHVTNGLPQFSLVGLPEASVKESKDRVRSALMNSGYQLPPKRITLNLAPADLPKQGSRYDLPIALGILSATGQLKIQASLSDYEFLGELGLNGEIRPVTGVLPAVIQAKQANRIIILPEANLEEASVIKGARILGA